MTTIEEIKKYIIPSLEAMGIELVDVQLKGTGYRTLLRIYIDHDEGVTLARCTEASRVISDILDQKDLIATRYRLEVSSPGIDRPLTEEKHFVRNAGKTVRIEMRKDGMIKQIEGTLLGVDGEEIVVQHKDNIEKISMRDIITAKIVVSW